ncbi:MAG TPA: hypothetical protein VJ461_06495 [Candidatus Nanoarchaeia archaeon]|nr:hypothetical protein [Candidatus Nanoarchaeia archaeon]
MKTLREAQQELLMKEMRVAYWERNNDLPTLTELENIELEALI